MFCVAFFPDLVPSRSAEGRWMKDAQVGHAHEVETAIMTLKDVWDAAWRLHVGGA